MSKLIVEMEMPKHMCGDCEISIDGFACKKSRTNGGKCPIIGVLPDEHGRLIDEAVFCENVVKYSHQSTKTIGKALNATPTIIEMTPIVTERKDDEQIH